MKTTSLARAPRAARRLGGVAAALVAGVLLSACGGGSDDEVPVQRPVPPLPLEAVPTAAQSSTTAAVAYQQTLAAQPAFLTDVAEPINLDNVTLATSETAEPAEVN